MGRVIVLVVITALTLAVALTPPPTPSGPGVEAASRPQPVAICPVEEGSGRASVIHLVSDTNGAASVSVFGAGRVSTPVSRRTGETGAAAVSTGEMAAVGITSALVELPSARSAAVAMLQGETSLSFDLCPSMPSPQVVLAGGSTLSGQQHQIQIMNPYSGETVVDLEVRSESGIESNPALTGIVIPPRSAAVVDLASLLPGRESLAVTATAVRGRFVMAGRQAIAGDTALWPAVAEASDWFLPIAGGAGVDHLVVATSSAVEVAYQIDVYGSEGLIEAAVDGIVPAQGFVVVELAELGEAPMAVRLISSGPVAAFLRRAGATAVAITPGSPVTANDWMLPGAGTFPGGVITVLNPGIDEVVIGVVGLRGQSVGDSYLVPPSTLVEIPFLPGVSLGHLLTSTGPVVVSWTTVREGAVAFSGGYPIADG